MLCRRLLIPIIAISTVFISCKNNPASSDQPEHYKITGKVGNNFPDTPGPVWDAKVILISGSDSVITKTNDRGIFEYKQETPFDADNYEIQLQKDFYEDIGSAFTFPDSSFDTGVFNTGTFKMDISEEALYISGEIERSVEDDSVVVKFTPSTGCDNPSSEFERARNQRQNISSEAIFSFAISKTCQEIYITIDGKYHRKTRMYLVNMSNKEIKESPNRIEGLDYKIYEDVEPIPVTVVMSFYTVINGEKHAPVLPRYDVFNVTLPTSSPGKIELDEKGDVELEAKIAEGKDTLSIVMWNRNDMHYFNRKNFPLLDYEMSIENTIDLGEHEIQFGGVYIYGNLSDHYYDFKGNFQLTIDGESYRLNENKNFVFPSPVTSGSYQLELKADYYENMDTSITKTDLVADGDIYTGLNIDLIPTLYQIFIEVDLIDLDGSNLPSRTVPIDFSDGLDMTTENNGTVHLEVNSSKPVVYRFLLNNTNKNNSLDDFTSQQYEIDLSSHNNYSLEKQAAIYKIGPLVDYTSRVQVGTTWEFNYSQGIHYETANTLIHEGELSWEITETLTDSTFIMHESFEGTRMYYSAGEEYYSESDLTDSEYLVTVNNRKIKFEPQNIEESSKSVWFTEVFGYVLEMYQPSTFIKEYTTYEVIEDDFTKTTISTTFSETGGIKKFNYFLQDYDSEVVSASLKTYNP